MVEYHRDIRSEFFLNLDTSLRTQFDFGTVNVRPKRRARLLDLGQLGQAENLKSATVGQHGPFPTHEFLKSAQLLNDLGARSKVEVISVSQDDLRIGLFDQSSGQSFDGRARPDWHKCWKVDYPSRSDESSKPSSTMFVDVKEFEFKSRFVHGGWLAWRIRRIKKARPTMWPGPDFV